MEIEQAEYKSDIAHLAQQMAEHETRMADRSFRQLLATAGLLAIAGAILGLLIRL